MRALRRGAQPGAGPVGRQAAEVAVLGHGPVRAAGGSGVSARDQLRECFPDLTPGRVDDLIEDAVTALMEAVQRETRVAGAAEARVILGVSSQRFHLLKRQPGFPEPHQVLMSGPIWLVQVLEAYDLRRNKVPGRKAR